MTKRFRIVLLTLCLALLSCVGIGTVFAKYRKEFPVGTFDLRMEKLQAFAVYGDYTATDGTTSKALHFYNRSQLNTGDTIRLDDGSTHVATNVWTGFDEQETATSRTSWPWGTLRRQVKSVRVVDKGIAPKCTAYWFHEFAKIEYMDISNLDTSNVTNMSYMFAFEDDGEHGKITSLDLSSFDTSNVTNMSHMFEGHIGISSLDLSSFDTSNVTNMSYMFRWNYKLTSLDITTFNTEKVENMYYMFYNCAALSKIDVSSFDTLKVRSMGYMFAYCIKLTTIYASEKFLVQPEASTSYMFLGSEVLVGGAETTYNSNKTDGEYARIDGVDEKKGYFTAPIHEHNVAVWTPKDGNWHTGICSVYNEPVTEAHTSGCALCSEVVFVGNSNLSITQIPEGEEGEIKEWIDSGVVSSNQWTWYYPDGVENSENAGKNIYDIFFVSITGTGEGEVSLTLKVDRDYTDTSSYKDVVVIIMTQEAGDEGGIYAPINIADCTENTVTVTFDASQMVDLLNYTSSCTAMVGVLYNTP